MKVVWLRRAEHQLLTLAPTTAERIGARQISCDARSQRFALRASRRLPWYGDDFFVTIARAGDTIVVLRIAER